MIIYDTHVYVKISNCIMQTYIMQLRFAFCTKSLNWRGIQIHTYCIHNMVYILVSIETGHE